MSHDKDSDAAIMKAALLKQTKIRILIPRENKEPASVLKSVNINGYRLDFPKNTYIDVPEQFAELLKDSLEQTENALEQNSLEAGSDKSKQLLR